MRSRKKIINQPIDIVKVSERQKIKNTIVSDAIRSHGKRIRTATMKWVKRYTGNLRMHDRKKIAVNGLLLYESSRSFTRSFGLTEFKGSAVWRQIPRMTEIFGAAYRQRRSGSCTGENLSRSNKAD